MATTPAQLEEITVPVPFFVICLLCLAFFFPALACSLLYVYLLSFLFCACASVGIVCLKKTKKEMDSEIFTCNSHKTIPDSGTIEWSVCVCKR